MVMAATSSGLGPDVLVVIGGANCCTSLDITLVANTNKVRKTKTVPMPISMSSTPASINDDMLDAPNRSARVF